MTFKPSGQETTLMKRMFSWQLQGHCSKYTLNKLKVLEMHSYVKEEKLTFIVMVGKADNQLSKNVENSASEKQPKQEQK